MYGKTYLSKFTKQHKVLMHGHFKIVYNIQCSVYLNCKCLLINILISSATIYIICLCIISNDEGLKANLSLSTKRQTTLKAQRARASNQNGWQVLAGLRLKVKLAADDLERPCWSVLGRRAPALPPLSPLPPPPPRPTDHSTGIDIAYIRYDIRQLLRRSK